MLFKNGHLAQQRLRFFQIIQRYVDAGMSPTDSIERFNEGLEKDSPLLTMTHSMIRDMRNGQSFAEVLKKYPKFFQPFIIGLVTVGQESGQLPHILQEIVFHLEQDLDIKRKIDSATMIPKISVCAIFLVFMFGTMFIIPKLGEQLSDSGVELPLITQTVLNFGNLMQEYWYLVIAGFFGISAIFRYLLKKYPERMNILSMKLPIYAPLAYTRIQYNFSKVFGLCVNAGIRPSTALKYTSMAIDSLYLRNVITRAATKILNTGAAMDAALSHEDVEHFLNKDIYVMIRPGTESGNLGDIMLDESRNYQKELLNISDRIGDKVSMTILIPAYLVILALFASIEYPVITMMQAGMAGMAQ